MCLFVRKKGLEEDKESDGWCVLRRVLLSDTHLWTHRSFTLSTISQPSIFPITVILIFYFHLLLYFLDSLSFFHSNSWSLFLLVLLFLFLLSLNQGLEGRRIVNQEQSTSETPETEELKEWNIMKNYNYNKEKWDFIIC